MSNVYDLLDKYSLPDLDGTLNVKLESGKVYSKDEVTNVAGSLLAKGKDCLLIQIAGAHLWLVPIDAVASVEIDDSIKASPNYFDTIGCKMGLFSQSPVLCVQPSNAAQIVSTPGVAIAIPQPKPAKPTVIAKPSDASKYSVPTDKVQERDQQRQENLQKSGVDLTDQGAGKTKNTKVADAKTDAPVKDTFQHTKNSPSDTSQDSGYQSPHTTNAAGLGGSTSTDWYNDSKVDVTSDDNLDIETVDQPITTLNSPYDTKSWAEIETSFDTVSSSGITSTDTPLDPDPRVTSDTNDDVQSI